jgi:hypothetical protein
MSIQQFEAFWPKHPTFKIDKLMVKQHRLLVRSLLRTKRRTLVMLRRQYYVNDALVDARRAVVRNEDIVLASSIIIAVISFCTTSILAKAVYLFVMAGSVLSTISGFNLALLLLIACGVMGVLLGWIAAWMLNLLSISLMEGATRKQKRSLRLTIRKALRHASTTATAWGMLFVAAFGPAFMGLVGTLAVTYFVHASWSSSLPYVLGMGALCIVWIAWVLSQYTLLPYVRLFEPTHSWGAAAALSRRLVRRKGRVFILSGYLAFGGTLAIAYGTATLIQKLTGTNSTILFLLLSTVAVSVANAVLTMFYRKRKLARA